MLYTFQNLGLLYTSATNSGFLTSLFIIFLPPLLFFLKKEPLKSWHLVCAAVSIIGSFFLTTGAGNRLNLGDFLTIIAAIFYAIFVIKTGLLTKTDNPVNLVFTQFFFVGLFSLALSYPYSPPNNINAFHQILILTIFPTVIAFYLQLVFQKHISSLEAGLIFSQEAVFSLLTSYVLNLEKIHITQIFGGFVILSSLLLYHFTSYLVTTRNRGEETATLPPI